MSKISRYTKLHDMDTLLASKGKSIDDVRQAAQALNSFMRLFKDIDSELKDRLLQAAYENSNPVILGLKELGDRLTEFVQVEDGKEFDSSFEDPSALKNIKREEILTLAGEETITEGVVGRVFQGQRNSDKQDFIKLEAEYGNYFWNDDLANWNEDVSVHPEDEPRWVKARDFQW